MRWLSVALKQICDGRQVHRGISPVAVEEKVVSDPGKEDDGADEARGRDARLLVRRRG